VKRRSECWDYLTDELTHGEDVCLCVVHSDIILLRPAQANIRPGLENLVLLAESLPLRHEFLKMDDSA